MILLLEDNAERLERFAAVVRAMAPGVGVRVWRSARRMAREVEPLLGAARLLSLDHDLDPCADDPEDPGDGLELVKFLVRHSQPCPVIIHSSNRDRSDCMAGEFELAGWRYHRVAPLGEDWIEAHWGRVARRLLRRPSLTKR